jgi:glycerol-3-phosphate dehydrogenase
VRGVAPANGVAARRLPDGTVEVPGESITDPVHYTRALAAAARACGAEIRTGVRVTERLPGLTVNCAGLYADEVAHLYGDNSFEIYPRKGEFFVFDGIALDRILLPTPSARTKGVLVFPTLDRKVVAGPTAVDQEDKEDWSVRPEALAEVRAKAAELLPEIAGAEPVGSWAGLRPAGRAVNYVIRRTGDDLVNVAAIRSTGLTASLGIAEYVADLIVPGAAVAPLPAVTVEPSEVPWWRRS